MKAMGAELDMMLSLSLFGLLPPPKPQNPKTPKPQKNVPFQINFIIVQIGLKYIMILNSKIKPTSSKSCNRRYNLPYFHLGLSSFFLYLFFLFLCIIFGFYFLELNIKSLYFIFIFIDLKS